jgi:hypothetical protein
MGPQEEDPEEKSLLHLTPIKDGKVGYLCILGVERADGFLGGCYDVYRSDWLGACGV